MKVEIVTRKGCTECEKMKEKMARAGIPFSEIEMREDDSDLATEMIFNGIISLPAFAVEEGGKKRWMSRFNFEKWLESAGEKVQSQKKWMSMDVSKA